ncbi:N-acetyl-gamma-glutamyl-phosphate reductase [Chlorobium sp. BLA1]|uniref:N-acetyl-gamma-glutamyl-phosphate reductase n=1 Tax=Candidatus Chlorobium masyuteum TaxID=2716876 RepID=UPI00141F281F|nr:N-acetyl-gamma-glutamyl-phosphate reductase [Candidatus Chlorobium masyuteum]NHQ61130.1 N-acetyl-gamma-glutamyl-phosphate reductase [Candidatus Chlorobium masyuteum]
MPQSSDSSKKHTVSVIGASGYSGAELTRLLLHHPNVELHELYAFSQAGKQVTDLYPSLSCNKSYLPYSGQMESDIYFLALPHGEALAHAPALLRAGKTVIDLSGDFRLKNTLEHEQFYKQKKSPDAVMTYGLPELFKDQIVKGNSISNPGCFATSIILGLAPLFLGGSNPIPLSAVNCTSVSGISGAGRSSKTELSYSEMSENVRAYKVGVHQHTPEIMQALGSSATTPSFDFTFTPMIGSLVRGIYSILNIRLERPEKIETLNGIYQSFYRNAPFVRVRESMTEVRHVAYTNYCDIHIAQATRSGSVVIVTAIDNLLKGAAGQAVQNMNIMLGLDETTGLLL